MKFPVPEPSEQPEEPIAFFFEDVSFALPDESGLRAWLLSVAEAEGKPVWEINYIFCSDEHLRDAMLGSGMVDGMETSYARLEALTHEA